VVFSQTEWLIWARLECWIVSIETPSQTGEIAGSTELLWISGKPIQQTGAPSVRSCFNRVSPW
jgi:hypothetical protein